MLPSLTNILCERSTRNMSQTFTKISQGITYGSADLDLEVQDNSAVAIDVPETGNRQGGETAHVVMCLTENYRYSSVKLEVRITRRGRSCLFQRMGAGYLKDRGFLR